MTKNMAGLPFVKKHLPKHLHPYAHLIPSVVNDHVGWLDTAEKEGALAFGMAALGRAWEKWQRDKEAYSEAQFFAYARRCVQGIILEQFSGQIADRQMRAEARKEEVEHEIELRRQEREEIEAARHRRDRSDAEIAPISESRRSLTGLLQFSTQSRHESYASEWGDYGGDYEVSVTDDDGEQGFVSHAPAVTDMSNVEKLRLLLPDREAQLLRALALGASLTSICGEWGISTPRGSQLQKQAMARLEGYLKRLAAGERYEDLLTESLKSKGVAAKKQKAVRDTPDDPAFIEFCEMHGFDPQTKFAHRRYAETNQRFAELYAEFCREEGLDPQSELTDEQWEAFFGQWDGRSTSTSSRPSFLETRYAAFP